MIMSDDVEFSVSIPDMPDPLLTKAYEMAASRNVLAAVNNDIFYGFFSVCADGIGFGNDSTFPGLDWGQAAEALLLLGKEDLVRASWDYVKPFQRSDGLLPFAIFPGVAGTTVAAPYGYPLTIEANGGVFRHWVPGDPLRTLAAVTHIHLADAIIRYTGDNAWLEAQAQSLELTIRWFEHMTNVDGQIGGGGFYIERPTRLEYDGVNQCYSAYACDLAAGLFDVLRDSTVANRCRNLSMRITKNFREHFWNGNQFIEYIHPDHGPIASHGLTDVDWIAIASGAATPAQIQSLWPRLRRNQDFLYGDVPTGIATRPESYEDWEVQSIDRHDIAAMGRVWYIESWARAVMRDGEGLVASLRKVAEAGRRNDWYWCERYYSERTGDLSSAHINTYIEYAACFIRIVNKFLFGIRHELDGSLSLTPTVPDDFWIAGFGHRLQWQKKTLNYRFQRQRMTGAYRGAGPQQISIALPANARNPRFFVNTRPTACNIHQDRVVIEMPRSLQISKFELCWDQA